MKRAGRVSRIELQERIREEGAFDMNRVALNIDEVFFAALELEDRNARSAYLDEICGSDTDLRHRIEGLLAVNPLVSNFLESPAVAPTATIDSPCAEVAGPIIGPYKLLEPIGEGGMGTVYMAEQTHPVRRKVALKVIKAGMDRRIGEILIQLERYKGAGEALLRAEAIGQAFLAVDPENPEHRRDLAACYAAQGELPQEWATRLRVHQKAIALREGLADRFPGVPLYRKELAAGHQTLRTWYNFSRQAGADEHLGRAREIRERLSAENPADPDRLCDLGVTLRGLSEVRGFAGLHGDAEPYSRRALAIHDGLLARDPTRPRFWLQLAWDCVNLGHVLEHTRQYGEAGRVSGRAATMFEGLVSDYPDVSTYRENLAESLCVKVNALNQTGDCAEAERIIARLEKLGDARGISRRLADMAWHLVQRDAPRANPPAYAVELATRTRTRQPDSVFASHVLGMAYYRAGDWDAAIEALGRANALEHDEGFAFNGFFVAMAEHRKGDHEQARSWYDRSVAWMAENKPKDRDASRYRDEAAALLGMKTKQAGTASKPPAAPKRPPD